MMTETNLKDGQSPSVDDLKEQIKQLETQIKSADKAHDWDESNRLYRAQHELENQIMIHPDNDNYELNAKFLDSLKIATEEIDAKIAEASRALKEACELSEKYGIPFSSNVVFNYDSYWPRSLEGMWSKVGKDTLKRVFSFEESLSPGEYGDYDSGGGWVTSYC